MIALGFLCASFLATKLAEKRSLDPDKVLNCALFSFMVGILGARLYFVALSWEQFLEHPNEIFATWLGGLSIHGGIIGAVLAAYMYCRFRKLPFLVVCDIGGACAPLAQAIGRWGNFFNSEAFGRPLPADFPLKLFIPLQNRPAEMAQSSYFHPTFLYESAWDLGIFFILYFVVFKRIGERIPGMTFLVYIFLYSIGRLAIESLRVDTIMVGQLPVPSVVSALLILTSSISMFGLWFINRKAKPKAEPPKEP